MENSAVFGMGPNTEVTASLTIKDIVKVIESSEPGQNCETDEFMVEETPMSLVVFPNGYGEAHRGWVSVGIKNRSQVDVEVKAEFTAEETRRRKKNIIKAGRLTGKDHFLAHDYIKEHYMEKDFVVEVKVVMEGELVRIRGPRKRKSIGQEVTETAYRKMSWTNFTLVFDEEELACHKVILAGASPVFAAMLENEHREAREGRATIQLPAAVGRAFLRYIYLEELEEDILKDEVVAFLELGEKYQVEKLKEVAEAKMLQLLHRDNMVEFLMAGDLFRAPRIKAAALQLARRSLAWLRAEGREQLRKLPQDLVFELL